MKQFYFVSSSHLDREWYQSYEDFRIHIADIFFRVFDLLETSESFGVFMMDGQMSVVEDFLEIYPEQKDRLCRLAKEGKLLLGPWYTQPDELLVDGESHIRNLELGMKLAEEMGNVLPIGYLPDSFGHIAQMPQILNGFGFDKSFLMRGVEKDQDQEFIWTGPDGSRVKTIQNIYANCTIDITPETKEFGTGLLPDAKSILKRLDRLDKSKECPTLSDYKLVTYCSDHCAPAINFDEIIDELRSNGFDIRVGTLEEYFSTIPWDKVQTHFSGELREGIDMCLLRETAVSRPYLKRENHIVQTELIHQAEPILALAQLYGKPVSNAFLDHAWKLLLQNHTHDGICGCSINDVHDEMMMRYRKIEQIADNQIQKSGNLLMDTITLPTSNNDAATLLIVNTTCVPCAYAEASVVWPDYTGYQSFQLFDANGHEIPYQILKEVEDCRIISDIQIVQRFRRMVGYRILIPVSDMPECGFTTLQIQYSKTPAKHSVLAFTPPSLENEYLHVAFSENGTFTVTDKRTGKIYTDLHYFQDEGTAGDVYGYHPLDNDTPIDSRNLHWDIHQKDNGPLTQSVVLRANMPLPQCMEDEAKRSKYTVDNEITCRVSLKQGANHLEIHLCVDNQSEDHRLRLMLPTHINSNIAIADTPFFHKCRKAGQHPYYHPMQSFVHVHDSKSGFAFLSRGIPQHQLVNDENHTLAITLQHGRSRLYSWTGWRDTRFDGIQCLGKNEYDYALYFCDEADTTIDVQRCAYTFNCQPITIQRDAVLPNEDTVRWDAISIKGGNAQLSALRIIDNTHVELRLYNPTTQPTAATLQIGFPVKSVCEVALSGMELKKRRCAPEIPLQLAPAKIATLRFEI